MTFDILSVGQEEQRLGRSALWGDGGLGIVHPLYQEGSGNIEICLYVAVEVNYPWDLSSLASFAPSLSQLRNSYKFLFSQICVSDYISLGENEQLVATFMSWFCILDFLQQHHMNSAYFLQGYLDQVLMCLKISLEAL